MFWDRTLTERIHTMAHTFIKGVLGRMRPPRYQELSKAARNALLDELADLPPDMGPDREPACGRISRVIDALRRALKRDGVTDMDRQIVEGWHSLHNARPIAMFVDLAHLAVATLEIPDANPAPDPQVCGECGERIADGDTTREIPDIATGVDVPMHVECLQLAMSGHLHGVCGCTDYAGQPTRRAAALECARRVTAALDEDERARWEKSS